MNANASITSQALRFR